MHDPESTRVPSLASSARHWSMLTALGVVFGDLGTSPLYTVQTIVQIVGGKFTPESALGILSLLIWTLLITISGKYCLLVMRADNRGEGGILALMSLIGANSLARGAKFLTAMGLLGAALIYGDGVITPAISVLSALEGVNVVTAVFKPYVMPLAVVILVALFGAQRYGTEKIGNAFGPIMLLWFAVIAALGVIAIAHHPGVLAAVNPYYAIAFLSHSGTVGFLVLGGVFLCITGGEALYADMGHFGRAPIRWSWYTIVLPALLLSYAGQTAYLLDNGSGGGNPFFRIAPPWAIFPMVILATAATIIASQAIITGSFSMTRQAMQLGWMPGVRIRQTSDKLYGQIYVPVVNWLMMGATVIVTFAFGSSDRLAGAYGTAVSTTMLLTTILLYQAMIKVWKWPTALAVAVGGFLLIVDGGFFSANLVKIAEGGWVPLTFAAVLFVIMITWRGGIDAIRTSMSRISQTEDQFLRDLEGGRIPRVDGTMVFLTRSTYKVSRLIMDHAHFMGSLPRHVIALSVTFDSIPRIPAPNCHVVSQIAEGWWQISARFGFLEIPHLQQALQKAKGLDPSIDLGKAVFVATRDLIVHRPGSRVLRFGRLGLFAFLYRNAVKATDRFSLPPHSVLEIARQIEI
jgi:KUP system potassium uptake protein